jgi:hypothetical protein
LAKDRQFLAGFCPFLLVVAWHADTLCKQEAIDFGDDQFELMSNEDAKAFRPESP